MKGIVHALVAIGIIFVVWILILSFGFNLTAFTQRQLAEAKTLIDAQDVENIVRSLDNSFKLSYVQAVYDSLNTADYWQKYNQNLLTDDIIKSSERSVKTNFESYANKFLQAYATYVENNRAENTLLRDALKSATAQVIEFSPNPDRVSSLYVETVDCSELANKKPNHGQVDVKQIELKSKFRNVEIKTKLDFDYKIKTCVFQFFDVAKKFISDNRLGNAVMNSIKEYINGLGNADSKDTNSNPPKATFSKEFCSNKPEPTTAEVFQVSGQSLSQAPQDLGEKIKTKLIDLENEKEFTIDAKQRFVIENMEINSGSRGISTEVTPIRNVREDCNIQDTPEVCEKKYGPKGEIISSLPLKRKQCTFYFYGKVDTRIHIKDWQNQYAFWDKTIGVNGQNIYDYLKLSFNAVAGNMQ